MRRTAGLIVLLLGVTLVLGCGKSKKQRELEEAAEQMEKASEQMADAYEEMAKGGAEALEKMGEALSGTEKVGPVDFRELKKLLPESAAGMKRAEASGERTAAFGVNVSEAKGSYRASDGNGAIEVRIVDMGSVKGIAAMAALGWAYAEFDRETDSGYEKTTKYKGHRAFEKYDNETQSGEIQVLVAKRFMVGVEGYNIEMKALKSALDKIDLGKLEKMKAHGVED